MGARGAQAVRGACVAAAAALAVAAVVGCQGRAAERPVAVAVERPPAPEPLVIETSEWSYAGQPGRAIATPNYRIWTTQTDAVIAGRMPLFLERALEQYRTGLVSGPPLPPPDGPMDTFILATRSQWETLTRQLLGERAELYLRIPRGGYASAGRSVLFDIGTQNTMAVAAHEGWHQYTQRAFREPLPIWLEEGIATYMEGHRWGVPGRADTSGGAPTFLGWANAERFDTLRLAHAQNRLYTLEQLLEASPGGILVGAGTAAESQAALTYYAQVWALVHFLREGDGGRYALGLERVLREASVGAMSAKLAAHTARAEPRTRMLGPLPGRVVFEAYFDEDVAYASRAYERFVNEIVRPGTRGAVVEGRSPLAGP